MEMVPQELEQVKRSGGAAVGTCLSTPFRDVSGQRLCVVLFRDPLGRLGFSSGAWGVLMCPAQTDCPADIFSGIV